MPARKIIRKAIRNNKDKKRGQALRASHLGFVAFDISDDFSTDFACRHVVFLVNLRPWALERSDLTQSGGSGGRQTPGGSHPGLVTRK